MKKSETHIHYPYSFVLLYLGLLLMVLLFSLYACTLDKTSPADGDEKIQFNFLTAEEEAAGWALLFDGQSFEGWRGLGRDSMPEGHWTIKDGAIKKIPSGQVPLQQDGQPLAGGDILTNKTFADFELRFEWKISPGGNSGIKYNVSETMSTTFPPICSPWI